MTSDPPNAAARLLVVDDTPAQVKMLVRALEEARFCVRTAASGEEALASAVEFAPDLVLLDVDMGGISGFETCRRLKQQPHFGSTPVIFLSGLSDVADKMAAFAAGGVDFVTKPFSVDEVRARVATHLELERLRRAAEAHGRELDSSLEKLRELEHFRHDLVHMVAHDMRSPLMAVSGYLELLDLDRETLGEDQREFVAQALGGARTLVRLIDAMLDTDRLEFGKFPLQLADRDFRAVVDLAVTSLGPASARRLDLDGVAKELVPVHADGEILRRIVANLLANGLRNSGEEEMVRVVTRSAGDFARLEVTDRGAAIPEEFRSQVFEKYAARSGERHRDRRAAGLGLPFCRLATEAHGGRIGYSSGPGGSTFWIELPARPGFAEAAAPSS